MIVNLTEVLGKEYYELDLESDIKWENVGVNSRFLTLSIAQLQKLKLHTMSTSDYLVKYEINELYGNNEKIVWNMYLKGVQYDDFSNTVELHFKT